MSTEIKHFTNSAEIQHFAVEKVSENDNVYGVTYGDVVRQYLLHEYSKGESQTEVMSFGKNYKILVRREVTAFYDAEGNTLFDVENARLEKEYGYLTAIPDEQTDEVEDEDPVSEIVSEEQENESEAPVAAPEDIEKEPEVKKESDKQTVIEKAKEKLERELKNAKDKSFAEPVINMLLERIKESASLATDICQDHKTWEKCSKYIYDSARKQAKGNYCAVRDDVVYEWAEDYYHKDDKAEEEKKAKEAAERKKSQEKKSTQGNGKDKKPNKSFEDTATKKAKAEAKAAKENIKDDTKTKEEPKQKKSSKDIEGQMDLFSLMGM